MHVVLRQELLSHALSTVSRIIRPQNTMAVLSGVELETHNQTLQITATDLITTLAATLPADVRQPGRVVVQAAVLSELIRRIPTATLTLDCEPSANDVVVAYGPNRMSLQSFSGNLPPPPAGESIEDTLVIEPGLLNRAARSVLFACAKDETRPILRGVLLQLEPGRLVLAAGDGVRLSQTWIPVPTYRGDHWALVLTAKTLLEAGRLNAGESVTMGVSPTVVSVGTASVRLSSRPLDGTFPDFGRAIPQDYILHGRVRVADLSGALERVNILAARDRSGSVRLRYHDQRLELSTAVADMGRAIEWVEFAGHGPELDLLFNPQYLSDAVKSLEGEDAILQFSGAQSPLRIQDTSDLHYSHVLAPQRQLV